MTRADRPLKPMSPARLDAALARTPAPRTASPTLRKLFEMMLEDRLTLNEMSRRIRRSEKVLRDYKNGRNAPTILTLEELAAVAGYEIVLRRKGSSHD